MFVNKKSRFLMNHYKGHYSPKKNFRIFIFSMLYIEEL